MDAQQHELQPNATDVSLSALNSFSLQPQHTLEHIESLSPIESAAIALASLAVSDPQQIQAVLASTLQPAPAPQPQLLVPVPIAPQQPAVASSGQQVSVPQDQPPTMVNTSNMFSTSRARRPSGTISAPPHHIVPSAWQPSPSEQQAALSATRFTVSHGGEAVDMQQLNTPPSSMAAQYGGIMYPAAAEAALAMNAAAAASQSMLMSQQVHHQQMMAWERAARHAPAHVSNMSAVVSPVSKPTFGSLYPYKPPMYASPPAMPRATPFPTPAALSSAMTLMHAALHQPASLSAPCNVVSTSSHNTTPAQGSVMPGTGGEDVVNSTWPVSAFSAAALELSPIPSSIAPQEPNAAAMYPATGTGSMGVSQGSMWPPAAAWGAPATASAGASTQFNPVSQQSYTTADRHTGSCAATQPSLEFPTNVNTYKGSFTRHGSSKVKLLVSSGGAFTKDPSGQWDYMGGETRLVAVSQCGSLPELVDDIARSSSLNIDETCCLKYELPGFPEVLVDLVDDEDVLNMWDEWMEFCQVDKPNYKLRLFVEYPCFPLQALVEGSTSTSRSSALLPLAELETAGEGNGLHGTRDGNTTPQVLSAGSGGTAATPSTPIQRLGSCDTELSTDDINAITDRPRINLLDLEAKLEIIAPSAMQVIRFLGAGAYGEVYLSKWHSNDVAVKSLSPSLFAGAGFADNANEHVVEDLIKEASMLGSLRHPNIVWLYGIVLPEAKVHTLNCLKELLEPGQAIDALTVLSGFNDEPAMPQMGCIRPPALVAEYMSAGSVRAAINRKAEFLRPKPVKVKIALDAARGMEYLHAKRIVHFDLKSGNLLVGFRERHVVAKVADFGLSKQRQQTYVTGVTSLRGTLPWTAPEIIKTPQAVNEKVDLYSFGVVLWELWTGREPYEGINYHALVHMMAMQDDVRPTIPGASDWEGDVPEEPATGWSALMQQCWHQDPVQRPDFTEVVNALEEMRKECKSKALKERALSA